MVVLFEWFVAPMISVACAEVGEMRLDGTAVLGQGVGRGLQRRAGSGSPGQPGCPAGPDHVSLADGRAKRQKQVETARATAMMWGVQWEFRYSFRLEVQSI